jgi:hypothetical protein
MAIVGKVKVGQTNRTAIVSSNFKPKPNVALTELSDISISSVQNGQVIQYNSATGKFEANSVTATVVSVNGGSF